MMRAEHILEAVSICVEYGVWSMELEMVESYEASH